MARKEPNKTPPKRVKKPSPPPAPPAPYGVEAYDFPVEEIELEFDVKQLKAITKAAKAGNFVSVPEYLRHALREYMLKSKAEE